MLTLLNKMFRLCFVASNYDIHGGYMANAKFNDFCKRLAKDGYVHWDNIPGLMPPAHEQNTLSLLDRRLLTGLFMESCSTAEILDFIDNAGDVMTEQLKREIVIDFTSHFFDGESIGWWVKNCLLLSTSGIVQDLFNDIVSAERIKEIQAGNGHEEI